MRGQGAIVKVVILLGVMLPVSGCALSVGRAVDDFYNAHYRTTIEDVSLLSQQDHAKLREVAIIESAADGATASKGQVAGLACKLQAPNSKWLPALNDENGSTPEEAARTQLRIKALERGANAVVEPSCKHRRVMDWRNNCFESWVCTGKAVLVQ
jgi:hypothetical protein